MKKNSILWMYILVLGLLIYSCAKEEFVTQAITDDAPNKFQLVSPDDYVLASSDKALHDMVAKQLRQDFGRAYVFDIRKVEFAVFNNLTHAEITYLGETGRERNLIFYWNHADHAEQLKALPIAVPSCGTEECGDEGLEADCKTVKAGDVYKCKCPSAPLYTSNDCKMIVPGGGTFNCNGQGCASGNTFYACQVVFDPDSGDVECDCTVSGGTGCGTVVIELDGPGLGLNN